MVFIGQSECVVNLMNSTAKTIHCVTQALLDADLEGQTGHFVLPLTLYNPLARESDQGDVMATASAATCSIPEEDGGCVIGFDLSSQPNISAIATPTLGPDGVLRLSGDGLNGGTASSADADAESSDDGERFSSLEVRVRSTAQVSAPVAQCRMRDYNQARQQAALDDGSSLGPTSNHAAACQVSAGVVESQQAGKMTLEARQSNGNKGFAKLDEAGAKVDLVSGQR